MVGKVQNIQRRQQKWRILHFAIQSQQVLSPHIASELVSIKIKQSS